MGGHLQAPTPNSPFAAQKPPRIGRTYIIIFFKCVEWLVCKDMVRQGRYERIESQSIQHHHWNGRGTPLHVAAPAAETT